MSSAAHHLQLLFLFFRGQEEKVLNINKEAGKTALRSRKRCFHKAAKKQLKVLMNLKMVFLHRPPLLQVMKGALDWDAVLL